MIGANLCSSYCCLLTAEELANRDVPVTAYRAGRVNFDDAAHRNALEQVERVPGVKVV